MKAGRFAILVLVLFIAGCQKNAGNFTSGSLTQKYVTTFNLLEAVNPQYFRNMTAKVINQGITLQIPYGLAINKFIASSTRLNKSEVSIGRQNQISNERIDHTPTPIAFNVITSKGSVSYNNAETNTVFPELDQALEELRLQYNVPGLSVAIVKNEKLVFAKGYGYANKETHQPVNTESLFRIASLSKPITVIAILKLIQEGKLTLTDKVFGPVGILKNSYGRVPAGSGIENITVQHLLEHKAGWTNQPTDPMMANLDFSHQQLIANVVEHRPLTYSPGTNYSYSNFGYCVLGRIIEKITGKSYETYVQSNILIPMGIIDMRLAHNLPYQSALNEVKYYQDDDNPYVYNVIRMDAHGGWLATAADLMRLMIRIDRSSKKPDIVSSDLLNHTYMGYYNWFHTGSFPGTSAILSRLDNEYSFVVLANTRDNAEPFKITDALNTVIKNQILTKTNWPETDLFTTRVAGTQ